MTLAIFKTCQPAFLPRLIFAHLSRMNNADAIRMERPMTKSKVFAHTRWDAVPALACLFHLAYFFAVFFVYLHMPLWAMLILVFIYSLMAYATINGIGHN